MEEPKTNKLAVVGSGITWKEALVSVAEAVFKSLILRKAIKSGVMLMVS